MGNLGGGEAPEMKVTVTLVDLALDLEIYSVFFRNEHYTAILAIAHV